MGSAEAVTRGGIETAAILCGFIWMTMCLCADSGAEYVLFRSAGTCAGEWVRRLTMPFKPVFQIREPDVKRCCDWFVYRG